MSKYPAQITDLCLLAFYDLQGFCQDWSDHVGRNVMVDVRLTSKITIEQHRGYRGVILPQVLDAIETDNLVQFPEEFPRRKKLDVVHFFLKKMFMATRLKTKMGIELEYIPSMGDDDMSVEITRDFYEQIAAWYSATFHKALRMPEKHE